MSIENDETLQIFIEESLEHLSDIENDLLAIEENGPDIDEDLVNKVYRAAHSIKGGAGFMGLTNIQNLTHEMEDILGKIRSREMVPDSEIINVLLLASDALRNMINDIFNSNEIDISEHLEALRAILSGPSSEHDMDVPSGEDDTSNPRDIREIFDIDQDKITALIDDGKFIYLVEYDLVEDVLKKGKKPLDVIHEIQQCGEILESNIALERIEDLEKYENDTHQPFVFLFASILKPSDINILFETDEKNIYLLDREISLKPISVAKTDDVASDVESGPVPKKTESKKPEPSHDAKSVHRTEKKPPETKAKANRKTVMADTSLRVHVSLLDSLMTLAGELVLSRNQLIQARTSNDERAMDNACQRIDMITSELQEAIMKTRMQPVGNVFSKFPRVVRDLAKKLNKEIELIVEGQEVELDKTIIEGIGDPLTHLVRNAVDHGIETPDEREKAGKSTTGRVELRAFHEAGQVNIEIRDDGKGLDGDKLAEAAIKKGLLTEEQVVAMSEKEKINLIFMPGFSTAKEITDVSGRGVGMDVVKTNLDELGGVIDIESEIGKGTSIRIKLPLTLAIIPSQLVTAGGERYAIPQVNMEELLRIPAALVKDRVEKVGDAAVVRLRGNLLPLIKLADVIGIDATYTDPVTGLEMPDRRKNIADRRSKKHPGSHGGSTPETGEDLQGMVPRSSEDRRTSNSALNIVVVSTGTVKYGLIVDSLDDSEEIVVKPLGRHLKHCQGYAGATIMGDGRVALILDIAGISKMAGLDYTGTLRKEINIHDEEIKTDKDVQSLLMFRNAEDEQFSVPLGLVSRIEKIRREIIEEVGGKRVVQYREKSLPLLSIEDVATVKPIADTEELLVIVFNVAEREIGLLATSPVDAANVAAAFDDSTLRQTGILGSAIINGRTTQMVDIFELVKVMYPEWIKNMGTFTEEDTSRDAFILYAEDSRFFRTQLKGFLEDLGYRVLEAEDGEKAWDILCEKGRDIGLVITDIEMPKMNGFELAKKIKQDERFEHLPVIAMTTLAGEENVAKGLESGIDSYQIKLDKEKLLQSVRNFLG